MVDPHYSDDSRVAYLVGFLEGFIPTAWLVDPEKVAPECIARYEDVVYELRDRLVGDGENHDAQRRADTADGGD